VRANSKNSISICDHEAAESRTLNKSKIMHNTNVESRRIFLLRERKTSIYLRREQFQKTHTGAFLMKLEISSNKTSTLCILLVTFLVSTPITVVIANPK
jgi:hypothetical protein